MKLRYDQLPKEIRSDVKDAAIRAVAKELHRMATALEDGSLQVEPGDVVKCQVPDEYDFDIGSVEALKDMPE